MTIRTDFSYDMESSPRVVTVAAPSTTVAIQDLHDTLAAYSDSYEGGQFPILFSTSGKEDLGDGDYVGLTLTLQDAQLAFEARNGPTWVQCTVSGGNVVAVDTNGDTISAISPTAYTTIKIRASSSATISSLDILELPSLIESNVYDLSDGVETGMTLRQSLRILTAALAGKASGLGTNYPVFRDVNDTKDRITAETDIYGNRTSVTLDKS